LTQIDESKLPEAKKFQVFGWGSNNNGQLGLGFQSNSVSVPEDVDLDSKEASTIRKIDCSKIASAFLMSNGKVYTFGASRDGVLGHDFGLTAKNETIPRLVEGLEFHKVTDISLGDHHGAVVNQQGEVFAWGSLTHGKLGIAKEKPKHRARRVRDYGSGVQKSPKQSQFFGKGEGKIQANKILCTNQNTFVIGRSMYTLMFMNMYTDLNKFKTR
jgi:alpha-tubulin suppressor-like RCC1 family protein